MKTYARVVNNTVVEIIEPMFYDCDSPEGCEVEFKKGDLVPIERRFHPDVLLRCIDVTNITPRPEHGWTFDGSKFNAPETE